MRIFIVAALIILLNGLLSCLSNLPQDIGQDVPNGKLNSLSYAPFREGQSPLLQIFPTPAQIDEDLQLLSEKTQTFRTYSSTEGMDVVPQIAQKYGLKMIQGAWIGYTDTTNQKEIDALVKAANAYPDVIKRVIVGNEVLLRGERKPEELVNYIRQVKSRIQQPVSYADVWSMYMKHPDLIKEVDFITIHILPYWEDEPIPVAKAPAHIERIYKHVQEEADRIAPGKAILIGESGWPSEGKQRGWAIPSVVNEAAFIRGLLKVAADNQFDVNIVESFNQPWKSNLEGVVGANWGLFSSDRTEVFPLTGKVVEDVRWFNKYLISSVLLIILAAYYAKKLNQLNLSKLVAFLVLAQILCVLLVFHADKTWFTSYSHLERLAAALVSLLNSVITILILKRASQVATGSDTSSRLIVWLDTTYVIVFALMLFKTYQLAVGGRYISFPFELNQLALVGLLGVFVLRCLKNGFALGNFNFNVLIGRNPQLNQRNKQVGCLILLYIMGLVVGETLAFNSGRDFILAYPNSMDRLGWAITFTLTNGQLLCWITGLLIFALSLLLKPKCNAVEIAD